MTNIEKQEYDRKLLEKEVKKFKKKLDTLPLKSVRVTDIHLKIEEKPTILEVQDDGIIVDNRSFKDKIMSI